jgi:hypothetical protein
MKKEVKMKRKKLSASCLVVLLAVSLQAVAAGSFTAGQRVVLLQNDPPGATGLVMGHAGTVICCDNNDCSGSVLVSWDFWCSSKPPSVKCPNDPGTLYPANSAIWVDPNQVLLGVAFSQGGTIGKTAAGCVYLSGDDGKTYNVQATADEYLALDSAGNPVRFGDHVEVQGLLNTTPASGTTTRTCPQQDGDIYSPIIQPSATSSTEDTLPYSPGDRVVLLVSNPTGSGGRRAEGLAAGTVGTVICCGGTDPNFPIFVSWDGYRGGINDTCNPAQINYPDNSGWWMARSQITPSATSVPFGGVLVSVGGNPLYLSGDLSTPGTFTGCLDVAIQVNFLACLSVKVTPASGVGGTWSATVTPSTAAPGVTVVTICVYVVNLDTATVPVSGPAALVSLYAVPCP